TRRTSDLGNSPHDLTIAEDWRARITNGRTHLIELDILALHQSHPAGGSGRYTTLAHDIARLHSATDAMGGHTIVGIGYFSIRAKFNDGVIQFGVLRHHGSGWPNLPRISRGHRIPYLRAVTSGYSDLATISVSPRHRQRAHGLIIDVNRRARTIQHVALPQGLLGLFKLTGCSKKGHVAAV